MSIHNLKTTINAFSELMALIVLVSLRVGEKIDGDTHTILTMTSLLYFIIVMVLLKEGEK
jgi:hypothetical protein